MDDQTKAEIDALVASGLEKDEQIAELEGRVKCLESQFRGHGEVIQKLLEAAASNEARTMKLIENQRDLLNYLKNQ